MNLVPVCRGAQNLVLQSWEFRVGTREWIYITQCAVAVRWTLDSAITDRQAARSDWISKEWWSGSHGYCVLHFTGAEVGFVATVCPAACFNDLRDKPLTRTFSRHYAHSQNCEKRLSASSCLPVRPHRTRITENRFSRKFCTSILRKSVDKNLTGITGTLHEDLCTFLTTSRCSSSTEKCFWQELYRKSKPTFYVQ